MDFRLRCEMWKWMDKEKYTHDCDVVSVAGASKGIADSSSAKATADKGGVGDLLLPQIDLAYNLHEVRHVILMHHNDCGAYLNSYQFENEKAEKEKQFEDMKKAKKIIEERYLGVEVVLVWAELQDEDGEQIEF